LFQRKAAAFAAGDSSRRQLVGGVGLGLGFNIAVLGVTYLTATVPTEIDVPNNVHGVLLRYGLASLVLSAVVIGAVLVKPSYRPQFKARSLAYIVLGYVVGGPVTAFIVAPVIGLLGAWGR
jgi:hypothetical protein